MRKVLVFTIPAMLLLASHAMAGKYNKKLSIGDKAPAWKDLIGVDDKTHSLEDVAKAKAVVVVFTCNHCPVAMAYEDRLVKFAKDYEPKGVAVVAINVNNLPEDKLDQMKVRAKQKGFTFPYLYDPTQKIARDYGATCTPHWFLLDGERKIAFMGSFDDNQDSSRVKDKYLEKAADAVLAGKKPEVTETRQFGCSIKYEGE
ncbi:MAG: thioredoxin family protein [Planctomycetota bacterium]